MPPPRAAVSYKKKDGSLTLSADTKFLFWTPSSPANASPSVTVPAADITNLQQTPESSAKAALKIFVGSDSHVFSFTRERAEARKEQEAITDALRNVLAAVKVSQAAQVVVGSGDRTPTPAPKQGLQDGASDVGQSAAMAIAKATASRGRDEDKDKWYDDNTLKNDFSLQRSLLDANKALKERFNQSLSDKPETVTATQFTTQFWSTRLHLLRAHAIEQAQKAGEYNVLPEIKFVRVPGVDGQQDTKRLNLTRDQIILIFKQYPVVKEAYDENCPPMEQGMFWQRFFNSRLLRKLKGEKITQQDPPDSILDRYLDRRELGGPTSVAGSVPHFIDLEGNEQNHSQRKGNRPDETMRPSDTNKVPILRVLNNLSEKMMSHVAPEDGEAHAPIGLDESTFEELRLRDLAMEDADNRVVLNVREQQRFLSRGEGDDESREAKLYRMQNPDKVLKSLRNDLISQQPGVEGTGWSLDRAIGYDTSTHGIGAGLAMSTATTSILDSLHQRRAQLSSSTADLHGLSQQTFDALAMTHNTTNEFLHYFWTLFLSGDSAKAAELQGLITTLDRSLDRINAVGDSAEAERQQRIEKLKQQIQEHFKRTGKKRKYDFDSVTGGRKVLEVMIKPTVGALQQATGTYKRAWEEQSAIANHAAAASGNNA